ncbi:MAG TPA: transglycosylase domain-containing protein [Paludibacteraceae bacterium]|nr:transglycosylase domain-containing protein [Paludibacteraceae bacterium]
MKNILAKLKHRASRFLHFSKKHKKKILISILFLFISLILLLGLFIYAVDKNMFGLFGETPSAQQLDNPIQVEASEIYSADGVLIGKYFTENRTSVPLDKISQELIHTLIHTEDERFYSHHGIDYIGLPGAFKDAIFGKARGASTISQQLVKNLFKMRSEYNKGFFCKVPGLKTLIVKVKEWIVASRIEDRYTKEQILNMYLNTVYFGSNAYGIKAAAKTYFNTTPAKLNYEQSACIIGILKATSYYNPVRNPENNLNRRNTILKNLQDNDVIDEHMCDSLCQLPLNLSFKSESNLNGYALYFRDAVSNELQEWCEKNDVDLYQDGLKIYTSIDSRMQKYAEESVSKQMAETQKLFMKHWGKRNPWRDRNNREMKTFISETLLKTDVYRGLSAKYKGNKDSINLYLHRPHKMKIFDYRKGIKDTVLSSVDSLKHILKYLHCGFVAIQPQTGLVKAWVGDVDYRYWQYDKVLTKRQPGSTFKLFVYAEAIRQGKCPCDVMKDSSTTWNYTEDGKQVTWNPQNANGIYSDEKVTLKTAFARSINTIAVQLAREEGTQNIVDLAHQMGIESDIRPIPSICLGTEDVSLLEMVSAYTSIVNEGTRVQPIIVTHIKDKEGNVIYKNKTIKKKALDYETAFLMREMLREGLVDERGTSQRLKQYRIHNSTDFGGKTGSTANYSDAWYIGISPKLVAGAWVGGEYRCIHFSSGDLGQGSRSALPIFGRFMEKVLNDKKLASYRGRFGEPKEDISKEYKCLPVEQQDHGIKKFWKRLFGRDDDEETLEKSEKKENVKEGEKKSKRELRKERRKARKEKKRLEKERKKREKELEKARKQQ